MYYKHSCTTFCFSSVEYISESQVSVLYSYSSLFDSLRNSYTIFQNICTILHSHKQYMIVTVSAYTCQHLCLSIFCVIVCIFSSQTLSPSLPTSLPLGNRESILYICESKQMLLSARYKSVHSLCWTPVTLE